MPPDSIHGFDSDTAAPFDWDGEAGDDKVGDEDACEDDCEGDTEELPPSMDVRVLSNAKLADTPEELVQEDGGVPFPETKFTCMHWRRIKNVRGQRQTVKQSYFGIHAW